MFFKCSRLSFMVAGWLLLMSSYSSAQTTDTPPVIKALEDQGFAVVKEFKAGGGLRGFAGMAGGQPVAVYVTSDGDAIVGARLNAQGVPLDEAMIEKSVAKPVSDKAWAQLQSSTWVLDGKADAARIIYTFSDANCPYCHRFWEASRPWVDAGKVQLRHILVGIIKADSPAKAAAILGASDRSAALLENEEKYGHGGITPAKTVPADVRKILDDNQQLMLAMGFQGTPGIVARDSSGLLEKYNGMPPQSTLAEIFGPR